ncbi:phosphoribosylanthranilate isomerase [Aquiflexum lacus]|uniref:phosphoribosylanthranilate isomerase n=1 Tax=Aquiflexum lacus TaxID=2483805 RepID=UPI00293C117F|nr:phosphoribosylanthranilate isomerase [Aquiflexum lacus]
MMKLKVCGMREPENIRELMEQIKSDWMGLIFHPPSPRYVDSIHADFIQQLKVKKVGVFVNAEISDIEEKIQSFGLTTLQLHGQETVDEVSKIKEKTGLEIFKVFSVTDIIDWNLLEVYLPFVDFFLFDTFTKSYGGSGKTFNWQLLKDYPFEKPFLLSGGLSLDQTEEIKNLQSQAPQMKGIDINSKFEIEPGIKDIALIEKFKGKI